MEHECVKIQEIAEVTESAKSAHHRIDEHGTAIRELSIEVGTVKSTVIKLEVILERLDATVAKLANAISKAIWAIIVPIILAAIFAALKMG